MCECQGVSSASVIPCSFVRISFSRCLCLPSVVTWTHADRGCFTGYLVSSLMSSACIVMRTADTVIQGHSDTKMFRMKARRQKVFFLSFVHSYLFHFISFIWFLTFSYLFALPCNLFHLSFPCCLHCMSESVFLNIYIYIIFTSDFIFQIFSITHRLTLRCCLATIDSGRTAPASSSVHCQFTQLHTDRNDAREKCKSDHDGYASHKC